VELPRAVQTGRQEEVSNLKPRFNLIIAHARSRRTSRLAYSEGGKSLIFTPVRESSGERRLNHNMMPY
jgi:hypothetical protein